MHSVLQRMKIGTALLALAGTYLGASLWANGARADEPIKATEPALMAEPGEVVDVIDAFDTKNNDPFDLNLSLGFHQAWESAKIKRESNLGPNGLESNAGFTHNLENIASYKHSTSTLNVRADLGLFRDLALFVRVPFILADDRSLDDLDGSAPGVNAPFGRASDTANGAPFFKLPFKAPTRSGVDYMAAGLRWSIFNQHRDPTKPTLTLELEGRFGIGEPLHACNDTPDVDPDTKRPLPKCADPNAVKDKGNLYVRDVNGPDRGPGISRGTNAVKFGVMSSYRYRYVEPYGGFWFMAEFQKRGTDMGDFSGIQGAITNHPPLTGGLVGGIMIHPWENREAFQRFTIDLRFDGKYVSQGRDYTPLFDALGSSNAPSLVAPNPASYKDGGTEIGPDGKPTVKSVGNYGQTIPFTGVTDVEAYGIFGGHVGFIVQAAQYIRFNMGVGLTHIQAHLISASDACNPDFTPTQGEAGRCRVAGTGSVTGAPNPNHRPDIDLPGRRFLVTETFIWDTWVNGTVMF
jgi:hypothetical protein